MREARFLAGTTTRCAGSTSKCNTSLGPCSQKDAVSRPSVARAARLSASLVPPGPVCGMSRSAAELGGRLRRPRRRERQGCGSQLERTDIRFRRPGPGGTPCPLGFRDAFWLHGPRVLHLRVECTLRFLDTLQAFLLYIFQLWPQHSMERRWKLSFPSCRIAHAR